MSSKPLRVCTVRSQEPMHRHTHTDRHLDVGSQEPRRAPSPNPALWGTYTIVTVSAYLGGAGVCVCVCLNILFVKADVKLDVESF